MQFFELVVDMFLKGGFFMWPLLLCAIAGIVLIIERMLFLRENQINWDHFQFELRSALKNNNLDKAIVLAAKTPGMIGRVMQECLLRIQAGETDVESATEKEILSEMESMEKSRGWLANIIQVAPLLGLIGTVQGMIMCFMTIERTSTADPRVLANGIYTALITTFAGLLIAIPVSVAQEYIRKRINKILHHLDLYLVEVREWLEHRDDPSAGSRLEAARTALETATKRESEAANAAVGAQPAPAIAGGQSHA